ncbi:MAG TPA: amino acid ABC transporter permease [Dehalococcoidia bacterium]|nr:amino acid ABC transporter permease [Dehalococcoidia bacterium]
MAEQPEPSSNGSKLLRTLGVESTMRIDPWWGLVVLVIILIVVLCVVSADPFWNMLRFVSDGILITVIITVSSFVLVLVLGLFGGLGRLSQNRFIYALATVYVEIVRGIPLLVQLIWWYYAFPAVIKEVGNSLGIQVLADYQANPIAMAIVGMTVCYGAYMSEIYRAGIQSIPRGQMEAARSLGMTRFQAMRHIILPQAIRVVLPPVGNEFIALLKDSSLVSVVAVTDLTRRGREYMSTHFNPIETWTMVALVYLVMTLLSARGVAWIEKRSKFER